MQKPVEPKKILCIHDLSGVGRCSLAVILPVLSVMGFQPVALPTVVLSTHTGGLGTPARMDGSAYGMAALEHYQALELQFDCIYTGYLGGEAQVALAEKAFALWPAAYKVVDPVMGDNGKAYSTVTPALIERIRSLCRALWRGKVWIIGMAILFAAIALGISYLVKQQWSATAITDRPTVNNLGGYYSQQQFLRISFSLG